MGPIIEFIKSRSLLRHREVLSLAIAVVLMKIVLKGIWYVNTEEKKLNFTLFSSVLLEAFLQAIKASAK